MKKPAGLRRVFELAGSSISSGYPFSGRTASLAGDQRHHQVCALRTWSIGSTMLSGGFLVNGPRR